MSLQNKINEDLKQAMKAKDQDKLRTIRAIKSQILLMASEGTQKDIADDMVLKAIQKMVKQRKDSLEIFIKENRSDLAQKEQAEIDILETYLPKPLAESEIEAILQELINESGASGMSDIGKVMPKAIQKIGAQADGKQINTLLRKLLN